MEDTEKSKVGAGCKLMSRIVPNGTLCGVEGEGKISPIRSAHSKEMDGYFASALA